MMRSTKEKETRSGAVRRGMGITGKLAAAIVVSVVIAVAVLLGIVYVEMSQALLEKSEDMLRTTTDKMIQETRAWMNGTLAMLETQRDTIEYEDMDIPEMTDYIKHTVDQNAAYPAGLYVALTDGSLYHASFVPGPDFDALTKSWYQNGVKSEDFILGDVYFDEDSQSYVVGASGVLKNSAGEVRGVAAADVYLDSISQIVSGVQIEETGGIFLVDTQTDTIIGHKDKEITGKKLSEADGSMYTYAAEQIRAGKTGLTLENNTYIQVENIPGSNWAAVAYVSRTEVLKELLQLTLSMLLIAGAAIVVLILLIVILVRRMIGIPVKELSRAATRIAEGELEQSIRYQSGDELGVLADDFNRVTVRLRDYVGYINEISEKLREIAGGNLAFTLEKEYTGEFEKIKTALDEISRELNRTMGQLQASSRDVASGAEQVSSGAVSLSQGSNEQAAEVETLAGHISAVSDSVHKVARGAQEASRISGELKRGLLSSNEKMQNMTEVIQKISDKSTQIHQIVKTIEDIAFQTNILALNAAVEASRAGSAGKGFAVVAEEVRNLAAKSDTAAKATKDLIEGSMASVSEGAKVVDQVTEALEKTASSAANVSTQMTVVVEAVEKQTISINQVTEGIDQISSVAQTNSATAQESAAASEELSAEAACLKQMVDQFTLAKE